MDLALGTLMNRVGVDTNHEQRDIFGEDMIST